MADGRWPMADGRWPMADGRWPMADKWDCSLIIGAAWELKNNLFMTDLRNLSAEGVARPTAIDSTIGHRFNHRPSKIRRHQFIHQICQSTLLAIDRRSQQR